MTLPPPPASCAKKPVSPPPGVVPGFQREMTYFFRHKKYGLIRKTVVFFLAEAFGRDVTISHEHTGFAFFFPSKWPSNV